MKPIVNSVEEVYRRKEGTGDAILDEVVNCLRMTRTIEAADLAILMDVKKSYLYGAMNILTGMPLGDFINRWRLLQARELLRANAASASMSNRTARLTEAAQRCGWRSHRVLLRVAKRYGFELES